ncbi:N-acetyltransferase [Streptomyces sp. NPDC020883]|uniref:N-acetyltransferase n=1 Tax=Streptomyces sp. NPDC020883 TaxID=3365099 RepID=UPI0037BCB17A
MPRDLTGAGFRLEPLGPQHNEADHEAWMSSIEHIRATPGFRDRGWPPPAGMSPADNLRDLQRHADDFAKRAGFTYTVLDNDDQVIGCVYIYPARSEQPDQPDQPHGSEQSNGSEQPAQSGHGIAAVRSWVRADRAALDGPLHDAVAAWLSSHWPFEGVRYRTERL